MAVIGTTCGQGLLRGPLNQDSADFIKAEIKGQSSENDAIRQSLHDDQIQGRPVEPAASSLESNLPSSPHYLSITRVLLQEVRMKVFKGLPLDCSLFPREGRAWL